MYSILIPGGPWITVKGFFIASSTAFCWLSFRSGRFRLSSTLFKLKFSTSASNSTQEGFDHVNTYMRYSYKAWRYFIQGVPITNVQKIFNIWHQNEFTTSWLRTDRKSQKHQVHVLYAFSSCQTHPFFIYLFFLIVVFV